MRNESDFHSIFGPPFGLTVCCSGESATKESDFSDRIKAVEKFLLTASELKIHLIGSKSLSRLAGQLPPYRMFVNRQSCWECRLRTCH